MAIVNRYTGCHVLIIDDLPGMRASLRTLTNSIGVESIAMASNIRDALEQMQVRQPDIILCDYYLGDDTNGQQFLQYLRARNLISRAVIFIMITAEKEHEMVITAAECMPDDYLTKPFTGEILHSRLEKLMEKKERFARVDKLQDQGKWGEVVACCDEIIAARDKFFVDALRIKGNALISMGNVDDAVKLYEQAIALRPMPWAKFGLARAMKTKGDLAASNQHLRDVIKDNPVFMAAYDMLSQNLVQGGHKDEALEVLSEARERSPYSLNRLRHIADIAEDLGKAAAVEDVMRTVVKTTKHSPLRESSDHARLSHALTTQGNTGEALAILNEARNVFRDPLDVAHLAAVEATAQHKAGNPEAAKAALDKALQSGTTFKLPERIALSVAEACLNLGETDRATEILKHVVQNNPDATQTHERVSGLFARAGLSEHASSFISSSLKEIVALNNEGVKLAQSGDFAGAFRMLSEAAQRLPNNALVAANTCFVLLLDVFRNGLDPAKLQQARSYQEKVQKLNPTHPKLADISNALNRIVDKYKGSK